MPIYMFVIMTLIIIAVVSLIYLVLRNKLEKDINKGLVGILLGIIPVALLIIGSSAGFYICPIPGIIFGISANKQGDRKGIIAVVLGVINILFGIFIHII